MKNFLQVVMILTTMLVLNFSCKKDSKSGTQPETNDINLATSATFGSYLTSKDGLSLYFFSNDANGGNNCQGGCALVWPPLIADQSTPKLDPSLNASDFGTIMLTGGQHQVTYKGWPLYTYSPATSDGYGNTVNQPEAAGSTKGDAVGGIWFLAKTDYNIMIANQQLKGLDGNDYKSDYTQGSGKTAYFTDQAGRTLYTFVVDSFNINKFTKPDLSNNNVFPIYEQQEAVVPSVVGKTDFGSIDVAGKKQMTYKGWPLYYFGKDTLRGLTLAVSVPTPGKWPVAVKDAAEAAR